MRYLPLWICVVVCLTTAGTAPSYAEGTTALPAPIRITEILAANTTGLRDENGERSDWVELTNTGDHAVALAAWSLTDDPAQPDKWRFPDTRLEPGAILIVFLSGDTRPPSDTGELHANFKLARAGEFIGLYRPGANGAVDKVDGVAFPNQHADISYGRLADSPAFVYFDPPSPGAVNIANDAYNGYLAPPKASKDRGFYDAPISVTLDSDVPDATIFYTRDGSWPTETNGECYTDTIAITSTTTLRAMVFKEGYLPSPPTTFTYLFLKDVPNQVADENVPEWLPVQLDPQILNDDRYGPEALEDALRALPTLAISAAHADLFGENRVWLKDEDEDQGTGTEVLASFELLYPDGTPAVHTRCGLKPRGGQESKRALECQFRSIYGQTRLESPPFREQPDQRPRPVNSLVLRSGDMAWGNVEDGPPITYARDEWGRRSQEALSGFAARGGFVHLYLNGLYFGVYNAAEEPDDYLAAQMLGDDTGTPFITKYRIEENDDYEPKGDPQAFYEFNERINANDLSDPEAYAAIQERVDIDALIDYFTILWYSGATDMYDNNWYAFMSTAPAGPLRFLVWDVESTWWSDPLAPAWKRCDYRDYQGYGNVPLFFLQDCNGFHEPFELNPILFRTWHALWRNADFRMRFADRVTATTTGNGALAPHSAVARWRGILEEIRPAILAEAARWGGLHDTPPRTPDDDWEPAVARLEEVMSDNAPVFRDRLRALDFLPAVPQPQFFAAAGPDATGPSLIIAGANEYELDLGHNGNGTTTPPIGTHQLLEGQNLALAAHPAEGYLFREWRGDIGNADARSDRIQITADRDRQIQAVFEVPAYHVEIVAHGSGETHPAPGTYPFLDGAALLLSAKPMAGSAFLGWSGAVDSGRTLAQVVVDRDMRIEAHFTPIDHTLAITVEGNGETIPDDEYVHGFQNGAQTAITTAPEPGWFFDHWEGDIGDADPKADPIILDMHQDRAITAVFARWRLEIVVEGEGLVAEPGEGSFVFGENEPVPLRAVPEADTAFVAWRDEDGEVLGNTWETEIIMDRDRQVRAVFDLADHQLTLDHAGDGQGQTVPPPGVYGFTQDQEVYLRWLPGPQTWFAGWDGDASGLTEGVFVAMNGDKHVTAQFDSTGHQLELAVFGDGGLAPAPGSHLFAEGSTVELSPTQFSSDQPFLHWVGNIGDTDPTSAPLVLTMDQDYQVAAVFAAQDATSNPAADAQAWAATHGEALDTDTTAVSAVDAPPDEALRIYYTLDGSDPRAPAKDPNDPGQRAPSALEYTGPIALDRSARIRARVRKGSVWSAINDAAFTVGNLRENLRITELMYHPEKEAASEFIEITNVGSEPANLAWVTFTEGISFQFPSYILNAGASVVVVSDRAAFEKQYGKAVSTMGPFSGRLNNGGERIRLEAPGGAVIADFVYEDAWYPATDGDGHSLVVVDSAPSQTTSADDATAWSASPTKAGTPGCHP